MKHRIIQYFLIITILSGLAGGYFYFQSNAAQKINSSKVNNLTSGLVGYWTFDGADMTATTALDKAGSNTGTLTGTPKPTPVIGKVGQALDFDGTNNYITAGSLNLGISGFTYCAWIYPRTLSGNRDIVHYNNSADNESIGFRIGGEATAKLDVFDGNAWLAKSNTTLLANNWYHVCTTSASLTSNGISDDTTNIYIGGSLDVSSTARSYNPYLESDNLYIANQIWGSGKFDGKIDEVRIYNRALSQSEITELYQQGQTKINASQDGKLESGLTGYWSFDGNNMDWSQGSAEAREISGANICSSGTVPCHGDTNNMTTANAAIGKIGQGMNFSAASSQYISTAGSTRNDLLGLTEGTVSVWVRPTGAPVNTAGDMWHLPAVVSEINNGSFGIHRGTVSSGPDKIWAYNAWEDTAIVGTSFTVGEWTHIIFLKNSTQLCIYKNEVEIECQNSSARIAPGLFYIGKAYGIGGVGAYFNGDIDEIRTYNRPLTQSEITELYQQGQTKINASQTGKLTSGLVGYWPLDGADVNIASPFTVTDRSGFSPASNGTLSGATKPSQAIGKIGQGLDFNGSTSYVAVPSASGTGPYITTGMVTVSVWFKADTLGGGDGWNSIAGKIDGGDNWNRGYLIYYDGGQIKFFTGTHFLAAAKAITNDGNWHHVVGMYDGTNNRIFIDNVEGTPSASASGLLNMSGTTDFRIGCSSASGSVPYYFFDGKIDEVRIYNRALSQSEVTELYNMGR